MFLLVLNNSGVQIRHASHQYHNHTKGYKHQSGTLPKKHRSGTVNIFLPVQMEELQMEKLTLQNKQSV
jgi:hypothetical protein